MYNNKLQRLDKLTAEYHDLNGKISRLDAFINHINFETTVPDAEERMLMCHQLTAMSSYRTNLKARIYLLKAQLEQDMDKNGPQVQQHHCGQDASCPVGGGCAAVITGDSLNDLLGMEVISVGDMPCDACNPDNYAGRPCVKVELVGGTYLCLAPMPNSIITE